MGGKLSLALALVMICAALVAGCGSSATTSPTEAKAVAAAEGRFLDEWGHALDVGAVQCAGKQGQAGYKCLRRVEIPPQSKAANRFVTFIEATVDQGVGPECGKALEEDLSGLVSISSFPGEAVEACRDESRQ